MPRLINTLQISKIQMPFTVGVFTLVVLALAFSTSPAMAQFADGDWEVGFTVGGIEFDDNVDPGSDTDPYVTLRGGYFFTDSFELELQRGDTFDVFSPNLETIFVNGVWNFRPAERISPYILGGVGLADLSFFNVFSGQTISDDSAAFQAAVGSRFLFGDDARWGLRVELTSIFEDTFSESSNHLLLSGGFTFRIGS